MTKTKFTVIEGGLKGDVSPSKDFDVASFLTEDETIDCHAIIARITPDMYGKTIDGVAYGRPDEKRFRAIRHYNPSTSRMV